MIKKIEALRAQIQSHLCALEKSGQFKFFKEKNEILLATELFLIDNPHEKLLMLSKESLKPLNSAFIEIENNLQGLVNA